MIGAKIQFEKKGSPVDSKDNCEGISSFYFIFFYEKF
jgi:hypothetical protein